MFKDTLTFASPQKKNIPSAIMSYEHSSCFVIYENISFFNARRLY